MWQASWQAAQAGFLHFIDFVCLASFIQCYALACTFEPIKQQPHSAMVIELFDKAGDIYEKIATK